MYGINIVSLPAGFPGSERLIAKVQALKAEVYARQEGAFKEEDLTDGRLVQEEDYDPRTTHLLLQEETGDVAGCLRLRFFDPTDLKFGDIELSKKHIAGDLKFGPMVMQAVEEKKGLAIDKRVNFVEIAALTLGKKFRNSTLPLFYLGLAAYVEARRHGGAIGVCYITTSHDADEYMQRLGGKPLEFSGLQVPKYFDPKHGRYMRTLEFDSSLLNPQYESRLARFPLVLSELAVQ